MSVLLSAGQILEKTGGLTGLSSSSPLTICGWVRVTDTANYRTFWALATASNSTELFLQFASGASGQLEFWQNSTIVGGLGSVQALDLWRWLAVVISGTSATFYSSPDGGPLSSGGGTVSGMTPTRFAIGQNYEFGEKWVGQVEAVKIWAAALNTTELAAERQSGPAVRTADLVASWNLRTADSTGYADASGNGNALVVASTGTAPATSGENSPATWGASDQDVFPGPSAPTNRAFTVTVAFGYEDRLEEGGTARWLEDGTARNLEEPSIGGGIPAQDVFPANAQTSARALSPALSVTAQPGVAPAATKSFAPAVAPSLSPDRAPASTRATTPAVAPTVAPAAAEARTQSFAPSISLTLSPGAAAAKQQGFTPGLSTTASPGLAPSTQQAFTPFIGDVQQLAPGRAPPATKAFGPGAIAVDASLSPGPAASRASGFGPGAIIVDALILPGSSPSRSSAQAPSVGYGIQPGSSPSSSGAPAPSAGHGVFGTPATASARGFSPSVEAFAPGDLVLFPGFVPSRARGLGGTPFFRPEGVEAGASEFSPAEGSLATDVQVSFAPTTAALE